MAHYSVSGVVSYVRSLVGLPHAGDLTDAVLLRRIASEQDEAALVSLLQRHGPLVLAVCHQVLADPHAAEDAFQVTFLVLAKKAASIRCHNSLGAWLHRVAYRAALKAKTAAARRQIHEKEASAMKGDGNDRAEWHPVLHEEIDRLPDKFRGPIVLCYLKDQTHEEAA